MSAPSRLIESSRRHCPHRRVHLDTDIAGDTDDLSTLVILLGAPDTELVGVTTVADGDGRRAGYATFVLDLVGAPRAGNCRRRQVPIGAVDG